jgi:glycosyltransferase involved in cell wall biosynthesis
MISVIIPTHDSERELAALLSVLVSAAVDGLVREVIAADAGSTDATLAICEDAGAEVAPSLEAAAQRAKGELLLVLPPAIRLRLGWEESLRRHMDGRGGTALLTEGRPTLLERFSGPRTAGVLISPEAFHRLKAQDLSDLRRRVGRAVRVS